MYSEQPLHYAAERGALWLNIWERGVFVRGRGVNSAWMECGPCFTSEITLWRFSWVLSACWIKWRAIFERSVTAWQHSYIVRVTPILSSLPPSWLLKCVARGRKQTARVWQTFISEHLHTLQLFTNLLGIFYFLVHLWNIFHWGLDFSFSCWKTWHSDKTRIKNHESSSS